MQATRGFAQVGQTEKTSAFMLLSSAIRADRFLLSKRTNNQLFYSTFGRRFWADGTLNSPPAQSPGRKRLYQNQTHKILHWKIKVIVFFIFAGFIIAYPFFSIKYFETFVALKMTLKFFLTPIVILLLLLGPKFYYKKVKPLDTAIPQSKSKEKFRDIFSIIMATIFTTMIFCGIAFSLIITTNKFLGKPEIVKVREPVEKYEPYITKYGRLRHYIDFKNPMTNNTIHLEVYRRYNVGEIFEKEMNYGFWGILYSTE